MDIYGSKDLLVPKDTKQEKQIHNIRKQKNPTRTEPRPNMTYECCMCGKISNGYGNSPVPYKKEGKCCDTCNIAVIKLRYSQMVNKYCNY